MDILHVEGFEEFSHLSQLGEAGYAAYAYLNGDTIDPTGGVNGGACYKAGDTTADRSYWSAPVGIYTTNGFSMDLFVNGVGSTARQFVQFLHGATKQITLQLNADLTLSICRGTTVLATSAGQVPLAAWFKLEVQYTVDASAGAVYVQVNGAAFVAVTGANTQATTSPVKQFGAGLAANTWVTYDLTAAADTEWRATQVGHYVLARLFAPQRVTQYGHYVLKAALAEQRVSQYGHYVLGLGPAFSGAVEAAPQPLPFIVT